MLIVISNISILLLLLFCNIKCNAQAINVIEKLPRVEWSGKERGIMLTDSAKYTLLKQMLPKKERVEFVDYSMSDDDSVYYYPLSEYGLIFIDIDFDGDLDLLYSGMDGPMMQTATKVYYNRNSKLKHEFTLRDGILDIKRNNESYYVYTLFQPCCDSYTTRIDEYVFSMKDSAKFVGSISIIGRAYKPFKGLPNIKRNKLESSDSLTLYALRDDFRSTVPYFRQRNKEVREELRNKGMIELLHLSGQVKYAKLHTRTFNSETYNLVITEPLNNLPKMPMSLYEWSQGDKRRLVGWIKD